MPRVKLDEQALRRPGFVPGAGVFLADGQCWEFRKPVMRFVPTDNPTGYTVTGQILDDDGEFNAMYEAHNETPGWLTLFRMASYLLQLNYDLTTAQIATLVQLPTGAEGEDPQAEQIMEDILAVCRGDGPKPEAAGDASPPTPAG